MAKTSSFSHSNLSSMLRDHKKQMLSRDKLLLGCEAEANAEVGSEFSELDEQELWGNHVDDHHHHVHHPTQENYSMRGRRGMESPAYGLPLVSNINIPQQNHHVVSSTKVMLRQQSAPMNVPDWSKILGSSAKGNSIRDNGFFEDEDDETDDPYEQRLPPHELVARDYARSHVMTFSVYEGAGHTLKGRDMSRVRNAVLKQTGFL